MKKKYLIIFSLLIIILTGSIIGKINASKSIIQKSTIESMAVEQVERYWSLLERFYQNRHLKSPSDEEWQEVLSQEAFNNNNGMDNGRVYRPLPGQMGSSVRSITDFKIIDSKTLSSNIYDVTSIVVTGQYIFNDPTFSLTKQKTQYTKNYYFIEENGHILIDREEIISEICK